MKKITFLLVLLGMAFGSAHEALADYTYTYTVINYPTAENTRVTGVNYSGQLAGDFQDTTGMHGFFYDGLQTYTQLDYPNASSTSASGMNDSGHIVGYYQDTTGKHGFLYDGGAYTSLHFPDAAHTYTWATGVNNAGQIVGYYQTGPYGTYTNFFGFLYSNGTYTTFNYPGALYTWAMDINDSEQVVGYYQDSVGKHGFLYDGGTYTSIDYPGALDTYVYGINDIGNIVGVCKIGLMYHGFLYDGATYIIVDYPNAETWCSDINNLGKIAGYYYLADGLHGFLNCPSASNPDQIDTDNDGLSDTCDNCQGDFNPNQSDSDGDGPGDICDNCPGTINSAQADTDGDGIGDVCDIFDLNIFPPSPTENDMVTVLAEYQQPVVNPHIDLYVNQEQVETCDEPSCEYTGGPYPDGMAYSAGYLDGSGLYRTTDEMYTVTPNNDWDHDGILNADDNCPRIPNGPTLGTCTVGILETTCTGHAACGVDGFCSMNQEDSEFTCLVPSPHGTCDVALFGDGTGDVCDNDDDNDGCLDDNDLFPLTASDDDEVDLYLGIGDGFGADCDNCPDVYNADQANSDNDRFGDSCDNCPVVDNPLQFNNDLDAWGDRCDNCPRVWTNNQIDTDSDGAGDACDDDDDNDGFLDPDDLFPKDPSEWSDRDGDGVGDNGDMCRGFDDYLDRDADGFPDNCDNCPDNPNDQSDTDADWEGDACDCDDCIAGPNEDNVDCGGVCAMQCDLLDICLGIAPLPQYFSWHHDLSWNYRGWMCQDWMTDVKMQGDCGSCAAHAVLGSMEAIYNIENETDFLAGSLIPLDLSEQAIVSCWNAFGSGFGGCCGGWPAPHLFNYISDTGVPEESCFPYEDEDNSCGEWSPECDDRCGDWRDRRWFIEGFSTVRHNIKQKVICQGPVISCEYVWEDPSISHCIIIVGYDETDATFIIKNSWSDGWEDGGYDKIPFDHRWVRTRWYEVDEKWIPDTIHQ